MAAYGGDLGHLKNLNKRGFGIISGLNYRDPTVYHIQNHYNLPFSSTRVISSSTKTPWEVVTSGLVRMRKPGNLKGI